MFARVNRLCMLRIATHLFTIFRTVLKFTRSSLKNVVSRMMPFNGAGDFICHKQQSVS